MAAPTDNQHGERLGFGFPSSSLAGEVTPEPCLHRALPLLWCSGVVVQGG